MSVERARGGYRFEVYEDWRGEWRWRLVTGDGWVVGQSVCGYQTEAVAESSIRSLQPHIADARIGRSS